MNTQYKNEILVTENMKVPKNTVICGKNVYFSKDSYKTWNNNNILVVAPTGGGKTRCVVEPALTQAEGNYIVSDPKGRLYKSYAQYLKSKGYNVVKMDFIHPEKSLHYNPILLCKTTQDIQKLSHTLTYALQDKRSHSIDPFWDETTQMMLEATIGYMIETEEIPDEEKNITMLTNLLAENKRPGGERKETAFSDRMCTHNIWHLKKYGKPSWAYKRYREVNVSADKTFSTIIICASAKLAAFDTEELRIMLRCNDLNFTKIGTQKTALFVEVSDSDRSMDALVNLFYTQLMNTLCTFADDKCKNGRLPIPVQFILDDFATNARIDNFENMISNIRARNISAMIMVQSEAQLAQGYGESAVTIINNCSTYIYLGGTDPKMAKVMSERVERQPSTILNMPVNMCYICRRGEPPRYVEHFDIEWFHKEKGFIYGKPATKKTGGRKREEKQEVLEGPQI